jgi:hypothetical protein
MSTTMPRPLAVSDQQLSQIMAAAAVLAPADRSQFLQALADALRHEAVIGDGTLDRAIRYVIRPYFRPPVVRHDTPEHHHRVVGPELE